MRSNHRNKTTPPYSQPFVGICLMQTVIALSGILLPLLLSTVLMKMQPQTKKSTTHLHTPNSIHPTIYGIPHTIFNNAFNSRINQCKILMRKTYARTKERYRGWWDASGDESWIRLDHDGAFVRCRRSSKEKWIQHRLCKVFVDWKCDPSSSQHFL